MRSRCLVSWRTSLCLSNNLIDFQSRAESERSFRDWRDVIGLYWMLLNLNFVTWHSFYSHYQDQDLTNCTDRSATPRKWKINIFIINHRSSDNIYNLQTGSLGDHNNTFQRPENSTNCVYSGLVELRVRLKKIIFPKIYSKYSKTLRKSKKKRKIQFLTRAWESNPRYGQIYFLFPLFFLTPSLI